MSEFHVDNYQGTDSQKLAAAHSDAIKALPSTVVLPDRDMHLTTYLNVKPGVSLRGYGSTRSRLFLDYPGAAGPAGNSPYGLSLRGASAHPTEFSDFHIEGAGGGYYRLIIGASGSTGAPSDIALRNLAFGPCGQSFIELRDVSDSQIISCEGRFGGDNSYQGQSAIYKIHLVNSTDILLDDLTLGDPAHDHNQSFVTINHSERVTVRNSRIYGTRTYCLNTHGTGSTQILFENNLLVPGPAAKFGAVLVGNEAWGPDHGVTIRKNRMEGPGRFLEVREPSAVYVDDNEAPDCTELLKVWHPGARVYVTPASEAA